MSLNSFGTRSSLTVGSDTFDIFSLPALERAGLRRPEPAAVFAEDPAREPAPARRRGLRARRRHPRAGRMASRRDAGEGNFLHAGARPAAGLHRACRASSISRRCATASCDSAATRSASTRCSRSSSSSITRCRSITSGGPIRSRSTPSSSTSAIASATCSCAGDRRRFATSASFRPRPASSTRSTSSTSRASCAATRSPAGPSRIPTRCSGPTRTRRWSTVWASSDGASAASRPRRRCSVSRARCSFRRSSATSCPAGCRKATTATDLVLTITEALRKKGVVGAFVEFYGPGLAHLTIADRVTLGNMCPEYGATVAIFPIDDMTLEYLRFTGRDAGQVALVEVVRQGAGPVPDGRFAGRDLHGHARRSTSATVEPSLAGPRRPQDRVPLTRAKASFSTALPDLQKGIKKPAPAAGAAGGAAVAEAVETTLEHGSVVIAAITSCTNTSNPSVMIAAGLVARKAVERGLRSKPWVKTSLAPGSKVVTDYLAKAGLQTYLDAARLQPRRATAARPASATAVRCRTTSRPRCASTSSSCAPCSRATATSRAAFSRTCARTTSRRRRWSSRTRSPAA